jgi:hypothetical protein
MSKRKLFRVLFDINMNCRHEGLRAQAMDRKVAWTKLEPGDILAFINTKRDRVMALAITDETDGFGVLGYYRSPHGRIDLMAIQYIAEAFGGGRLDMDGATKKALLKRLSRKVSHGKEAEEGKVTGKDGNRGSSEAAHTVAPAS